MDCHSIQTNWQNKPSKNKNFKNKLIINSKLTVYLDIKLQISASHVTRDNCFNQFDGNQLITIIPRTSDVMCISVKYLATQIPVSTYLSSQISSLHQHTHTHTRFTALFDLVRDYLGEPAPEGKTSTVKPIWIYRSKR